MSMRFFDFYRRRARSAAQAKERLHGIVALQRMQNEGYEFLPRMQHEVLDVVRRFMDVEHDTVRIGIDRVEGHNVLNIDIPLTRAVVRPCEDAALHEPVGGQWSMVHSKEAKDDTEAAAT
jgi:cell division topological specificity factor